MPTDYIIALLVAERDRLNRAIEALGATMPKRRGRPPKNPLAVAAISPKRHHMRTATARAAQAARMREYWAKKRKVNSK